MKVIRQSTADKVKAEIRKLQTKPLEEVADSLATILNALLDTNMKSYQRKAKSIVMEGSDWEQKVALHTNDLKSQLEALMQNCKDKMLADVSQRAKSAHEDSIREMLHNSVNTLSDKLAVELKDGYVLKVETYNENLHDILKRGFGMDRDEVFHFLSESEKTAHDFCIRELQTVFKQNANTNLLRKFNEHFKKDE